MLHFLDRPNPFTQRGIGVNKSSKRRLIASVFIKDIQWKYLKWQVEGGIRHARQKLNPTPTTNKKLNKFKECGCCSYLDKCKE